MYALNCNHWLIFKIKFCICWQQKAKGAAQDTSEEAKKNLRKAESKGEDVKSRAEDLGSSAETKGKEAIDSAKQGIDSSAKKINLDNVTPFFPDEK